MYTINSSLVSMFSVRNLLNPKIAPIAAKRSVGKNLGKKPYTWPGEGIQYPGFQYYPRHNKEVDVDHKPPKLFRVQRIKPLKGLPYWEKNLLKDYKLHGWPNEISIVKNIPENNERLWRIKHLIKISPITFPNGMPEDSDGTFLKENGELVIRKKIFAQVERDRAGVQFESNPKRLNGDTIRRELRKRWISGWR